MNKKIQKTGWTLLLLIGLIPVKAQEYALETLILKDGSELRGYIVNQHPGENVCFIASQSVRYIPAKQIKEIISRETPVTELTANWRTWMQTNVTPNNTNQTLSLATLTTVNQESYTVKILEKGDVIKFLDLDTHTFTLPWDTIQAMRKEPRSYLSLSGTNDVLQLEDGHHIEGQIIEQIPGKTIKIRRSDGVVEIVNLQQIVKTSITKINPDQKLIEQLPLLDLLYLNNNTTLKGVIIERTIGKKAADCYLVIQTEKGDSHIVQTDQVKEYAKEINKQFNPLMDILVDKGTFLVNRHPAPTCPVIEKEKALLLQSDSTNIILQADSLIHGICIETNYPTLQKMDLTLVMVKPYKLNKTIKQGFSYEDLVKYSIAPAEMRTSINQTTRILYPVHTPGLYALYLKGNKEAILFRVK